MPDLSPAKWDDMMVAAEYGLYTMILDDLVPYPTYTPNGVAGPQPEEIHVPKLTDYLLTLTVTRGRADSLNPD
jgi:hypothetical protein